MSAAAVCVRTAAIDVGLEATSAFCATNDQTIVLGVFSAAFRNVRADFTLEEALKMAGMQSEIRATTQQKSKTCGHNLPFVSLSSRQGMCHLDKHIVIRRNSCHQVNHSSAHQTSIPCHRQECNSASPPECQRVRTGTSCFRSNH